MSNSITATSVRQLVQRFEEKTIPAEEWTHEAHLLTALYYLKHYTKDEATCWLRSGIITYNHSLGNQNSPTGGYHETLTLFWIEVIDQFIKKNSQLALSDLCHAFLSSPFSDKKLPEVYYTKGRLMSTEGRARWVAPDRQPFEWE